MAERTETEKRTFGTVAVIVAFLALFTVLVGPALHDALFPQPTLEEQLVESIAKVRDGVVARVTGAPAKERRSATSGNPELPYTASLTFAGAALVLGCLSYLRREDHRYAYVACGVGALTLAWYAVMLATAVAVGCAILFALVAALGDG